MIDLEILRLELNYLKTGVREMIGESEEREIGEAINLLVFCFLNPTNYTSPDISKAIQLIKEHLGVIQEVMGPNEYEIIKSNLITIGSLLKRLKFESSILS